MRRRTLRNLLTLCDEAGRLIRSQGRPVPAQADLMMWLQPCAKAVTRAHRMADRAARLQAEAAEAAQVAAASALDSVAAVVARWAEAVPAEPQPARAAGPYGVRFDPDRFAVRLVELPRREGEPAGGLR